MLIAQISDCHVTAPGKTLFGAMDAAACLRRAMDVLKGLPARPDLILATGDLTESGSAEEYRALLDAMGKPPCPVLPLAGNHDRRDALIAAFGLAARVTLLDGFVQYAFDAGALRILALDTVVPGETGGGFCAQRLEWLRAQLRDDRPTLVAMHHPPFATGIGWLDGSLDWAHALEQELARHPNILRVVSGHAHRAMVTTWAGKSALVCPSTAHQVLPDLRADATRRFTREAPGLVLHQLDGGALRSVFVSTERTLDML